MIKSYLFYFFLVLILSIIAVEWQTGRLKVPGRPNRQTIEAPVNNLKSIRLDEAEYAYDYFLVDGRTSLASFFNLDSKQTSGDILASKQCRYLSSGGFYGKDDRPIGALTVEGNTLSPHTANQLFNGQLVASAGGELAITDQGRLGAWQTIIQTGPILFRAGQPLSLLINNDEPERRIVAIVDENNLGRIMIIVSPDSNFTGPTLQQLPAVLSAIADDQNFKITDAINLDGGTASVFKNDQNYIKEMKTVGTFLCFK